MGGRGASSGMSDKGIPYGQEYKTLVKSGNIKIIKRNSGAATAPLETMTRGRVSATVNDKNEVAFISYYDNDNKKSKVIDLGRPHKGLSPHTHHGYYHSENDSVKGAASVTPNEQKMIDRVEALWYNYLRNK